ncbi:DUF2628 domain-containing protein [Chenggangzhangella methanolivorans]|uniref:DUF2628 domain-containing protein n=1 Tax=Chenggangzhangella methanolivorans TaxID=1437009 RepID=UPI003607C6F8
MRNWLIYEPPGGARATLEDAEGFVTVREGFSKAAFLFAPFWLAWRRCWHALGVWVAAVLGAALLIALLDLKDGAATALIALPSVAVGFEAAWIRARALERRGYALAGSALARSREEAEALFFVDWIEDAREALEAPRAAVSAAPFRPAPAGVLGLFPSPGAQR